MAEYSIVNRTVVGSTPTASVLGMLSNWLAQLTVNQPS